MSFFISGFFLLTALNFSGCKSEKDMIDTVATPIPAAVSKIRIVDPYYKRKVELKTAVFYRANGYERAWLTKRRPEKLFEAYVAEAKNSHTYGFVVDDYQITELEKAVNALYENRDPRPDDVSDLDIRITASFFLFTTHLIEGRIRFPGQREFFWEKGMPLENDIAMRVKIESPSDLVKEIDDLQPKDKQYRKLQHALAKYRALAEADTLPPVSTKINLHPGDSGVDIAAIRMKLELREGIKGRSSSSDIYDDKLAEALKGFQQRHGLEPDGVLNAETATWLNVSLKEKSELVALNLERLRWFPRIESDDDEIVINVPEYMLRVYRNSKEKMAMRVVLGSEFTPTPVFHDTLKYIVFSPTWMVPQSIFEREFLPKLRTDPIQFDTERFRFYKDGSEIDPALESWTEESLDVKRYSVVENPGDANSLGKVKFIMPNNYSVYLHDTPADRLFHREERALSHGCIRLEKPMEMALYLLEGQGWDEKKIAKSMKSTKPVKVDLEKDYPVHIVYRTVWVDDKDEVHFRKDIYGHDQRHLAQLQ